jgi:adenine-specific DNA-methyltransferase
VTAVDTARYAEVFAQCYVSTDAADIDSVALADEVARLNALPGHAGYVTETFCRRARFFRPENGEHIDAIRDAIERDHAGTALYPILLTSLIEAADRVDSTTGVQMAYVKHWAPRAHKPLELRVPALLPGRGCAVRADACAVVGELPPVDVAYLDPPYNQHRYFTNYHVWETLVAWDAPEPYGVACKRVDARDPATVSVFNRKRLMPHALAQVLRDVRAEVVVLSYNDESWICLDELVAMCATRGPVQVLAFDSKRYVGAQIGVFNPAGVRVGQVSHLRNVEYVLVVGADAALTVTGGNASCG